MYSYWLVYHLRVEPAQVVSEALLRLLVCCSRAEPELAVLELNLRSLADRLQALLVPAVLEPCHRSLVCCLQADCLLVDLESLAASKTAFVFVYERPSAC